MAIELNYSLGMSTADAPEIKKLGVVSTRGEMTPIVWKGRLYRIETGMVDGVRCGILYDCEKQCDVSYFGCNNRLLFYSGYCENDVLYAFATYLPESPEAGGVCTMFCSEDGINWTETKLFNRPGWRLFNTSVCKGPDGYRMAIEVCSATIPGDPLYAEELDPDIGHPFTEFFLKSDDLVHWEWLPLDHCLSTERYTACPALRYLEEDGYYYIICLLPLPHVRYAPYIYRTKDFFTWEVGLHNPVLMYSKEDRILKPGVILPPSKKDAARIATYNNINNCDVDLCEFEGKTHIFYLTGDQGGFSIMCEAIYEGPMAEFLQAFFK